ncbi:MAG: PAS domain-containing protein [Bacteroidota bacterium]
MLSKSSVQIPQERQVKLIAFDTSPMNKAAVMESDDISIQELRVKYDQLRRAYSELLLAHEELSANKNLLVETLLTKEAKEKKQTAIIDNYPGALFLSKMDGTSIEVNSRASEMLGYTEAEFKTITRKNLVDETDQGLAKMARERDQFGKISGEMSVRKKNGERMYVDVSSCVFKDVLSGEDRVSTIMIDITERKKIEEALRISNERYVYATKATFDAIWDWDIINDHLYWGEGYEKIFGYKISNKIDNHIHSFDNIHPDDRTAVFAGIDELIKGNASNWTGEYRYKNIAGEYVYVQDRAVIIRDDTGKAVRMIGAMQDITERKKSEDAIKQSREKFTSLVNTIDGIVWEADAKNFQFTYVSDHAGKLLGYTWEEWKSGSTFWQDHIHPDDRDWVIDYCKDYTRRKKEHQFEYRMIAKDGRVVWLADFVTVVVENDQPKQLRGVMVDITARKKTEEELREKNIQLKELSRHLQNVSEEERKYLAREVHDELGQLAAVVKMDIDWLQLKMPDLPEAHTKRISHASSTTGLLISTIRRLASELRPVMLDELGLNTSLEWLCGKFEETNGIPCVFESFFEDDGLGILVKTALFRICQEALSNVKRHSSATSVSVSIYQNGNLIQLMISDNGVGFDAQQKTGTIGLIGMRERSLSVNGTLMIESAPGKGTIICTIIPKSR